MKVHQQTKKLTESAVMLALATVLGLLPLVQLPYGGSVTVASMLPIVLISYRHGLLWGTGTGLVFGVIQQLLGLSNLTYFTTWQSIVAIVVLDYLLAFAVAGVGGVFRTSKIEPRYALPLGALLGSFLRYVCHVISGATVWAGLSIPTGAALAFSFVYNATYMVPEAIVLCLFAYYLGTVLDFRGKEIRRVGAPAARSRAANVLSLLAGLFLIGGLAFDVATVFAHMQDPETGEFSVSALGGVAFLESFWVSVVVVSVCALTLAGIMLLARWWCLSRKKG